MDIQDGRCIVDTWDSLKQELRSQFFTGNVEASWSIQKHRDTRQGSQLKYLSPPRQINSKVDVLSGAKSPTTNECHTA